MPKGCRRCPTCGSFTGPRSLRCPDCLFVFPIKEKKDPNAPKGKRGRKKKNPETSETVVTKPIVDTSHGVACPYNLILIPSRHKHDPRPFCPVDWKGNSREEVISWLEEIRDFIVQDYGNTPHKYSRSAIKYFVGTFVTCNDSDYNRIIEVIEENMPPYKLELEEGY